MGPRSSYPDSPDTLAWTVGRWRGQPVLVVGDVMLDEWRYTRPERLSREAPVPVVTLRQQTDSAGGAGNTAVNLAALGARPALVAPLGDDAAGQRVRARLADAGVTDHTVTVPGLRTCTIRRVVAGDQIVLREEDRRAAPPALATADRLLDLLDTATAGTDGQAGPVLVVCDHGRGTLDGRVRRWLERHRDRFGFVALDAHDLAPWAGLKPDVITPSYAEAMRLIGPAPDEPAGLDRTAVILERTRNLLTSTNARAAAVTLDGDGVVVVSADGRSHRTGTHPAPPNHAVGAGDAYLAALTLALATRVDIAVAAELAQLAAAATVADAGTSVCREQALLDAVATRTGTGAGRIVDAAALAGVVRSHRGRGDRIVFTNGCFDVLHRGHVGYLVEARQLGDVLIVAVNSDASVQRLKGPERPVNQEEDRVAVLAALSCVDYVVVFEEDTPAALIETVRPDLYVKGGDYHPDTVPEAPQVRRLGGDVRILRYLPDRSTSAVIERIRARARRPEPSTIDSGT